MRDSLQEARIVRGYTHEDVARLIGVSRRMYTYIEAGRRDPSWKVAEKLERLFGVPASALLVKNPQLNTLTQPEVLEQVGDKR